VAKAVQSAVQQTADEVVRSVQTTDWKSELTAFTQEVEAEAQKVSHKAAEVSQKAVEVVQHLPAQLHTRTSEVRLLNSCRRL
jgi:N-acetylglucosamine kinase-like BadF-type ATPase